VLRQTFTAQRRQDRATVVWSGIAAASAASSEKCHQRQPVRRKLSDCRSRPGRVVRRRVINTLARFSGGAHAFYHYALNTCRSTTAQPWRHSKTSYSTCPVASGLLQRRAGQASSFHAATVPASPARSGTHRSGSQAAWPCDFSSSRVALVASRWEDPVQVVLAGSQVASGTHAGIHLRPSDIGCQYSRSIYTTRLIVWATSSCRGRWNRGSGKRGSGLESRDHNARLEIVKVEIAGEGKVWKAKVLECVAGYIDWKSRFDTRLFSAACGFGVQRLTWNKEIDSNVTAAQRWAEYLNVWLFFLSIVSVYLAAWNIQRIRYTNAFWITLVLLAVVTHLSKLIQCSTRQQC